MAKKATQTNPAEQIKKALWYRGYKVKNVAGLGGGYDLLVEGRFRVKVVAGAPTTVVAPNCDVVAAVWRGEAKETKVFSLKGKDTDHGGTFNTWQKNPIDIFGRPASRKTEVDEANQSIKK